MKEFADEVAEVGEKRTEDTENRASRPLMNSQAAAGIGTADGAKLVLPAAPGVPMSPNP